MKLLAKTSFYYILFSIPALLIATAIGYFMLATAIKENNKDFFKKQKAQVKKYIEQNDTLSLQVMIQNGEAGITSINTNSKIKNIYSDTLLYDNFEKELVDVHMLTTVLKTQNGNYLLKLWRSTLDTEELARGMMVMLAIILIFFLMIFFAVNWWVSRTLWKPFYSTIQSLQNFRASDKEKPTLQNTVIIEFSELNVTVSAMMDKLISDFNSQKQFTENASHEMQTPLAVIKSKIELLIQSDKLGEKEHDLIIGIDDASAKLARLNQSLLLLTKIENRQWKTEENISLNKIINDSLGQFEEHIEAKKITVTKIFSEDVILCINPDLCFILVSNLLQNAIRHNIHNGFIEINLQEKQLAISNTGQPLPMDASKIFKRFQKNSSSPESLGLGLAIAKEISDASGLMLQYKYELNNHRFILSF